METTTENNTDKSELRDLIVTTLEHMARGGVYDQLAGGFHRYSVDERWVVPHFEKMCYDNSELLKNYVHAYQATGEAVFCRSGPRHYSLDGRVAERPASAADSMHRRMLTSLWTMMATTSLGLSTRPARF